MKNIVIISSSIRNGSNSEILAHSLEKGALEKENKVTFISLKNKQINFCKGCLACGAKHQCVINDDVKEIMEIVKESDSIVFATPIYYYEMSGQLKTLLDRLNPLYASDYKFREVYMICTAADDSKSAFERAYNGLSGWVECFSKVELKKMICGGGINNPNQAATNLSKLEEAFNLGKEI